MSDSLTVYQRLRHAGIDTTESDMLVDRNLVYNTGKNGRGYTISPDNIRIGNEGADLSNDDPTPSIDNITVTNNIVLRTPSSWIVADASNVL